MRALKVIFFVCVITIMLYITSAPISDYRAPETAGLDEQAGTLIYEWRSVTPETEMPDESAAQDNEENQNPPDTQPGESDTGPSAEPYTPPVIANLPLDIINPYRKSYGSPYDEAGNLSAAQLTWSFRRNEEHQPPEGYFSIDIRQFGGYYLGDISQKVVYLTMDEGYEFGFTPDILDTLREKGVKAAFFVTKNFIEDQAELCKRMKEEGHVVGNHTVNHKNASTLTDEEMLFEITEVERCFKEATGYDMDKYFRFPSGDYSIRTLNIVKELGYTTVFWSLAYMDWDENKQPGKQYAFDHVAAYFHNGCIMLLHAKSQSNTEALGDIIDYVRSQGYSFETLDNLPEQ